MHTSRRLPTKAAAYGTVAAVALLLAGCGGSSDATEDAPIETNAATTEVTTTTAAATSTEPVLETTVVPETTVEQPDTAPTATDDCSTPATPFVAATSSTTTVTDLAGEVIFEVPDNDPDVADSPHPDYYFQTADGNVTAIDLSTGQDAGNFAGDEVQIAPDCSILVTGSGQVFAMDSNLQPMWETSGLYANLVAHPDGTVVAVTTELDDINIIDFATGDGLWSTVDGDDGFGVISKYAVVDSGQIRDARTADVLWTAPSSQPEFRDYATVVVDAQDRVTAYDVSDGTVLDVFDAEDVVGATTPLFAADIVVYIENGELHTVSADPQFVWQATFGDDADYVSSFSAGGDIMVVKGNQSELISAYDAGGDKLWSTSDLDVRRLSDANSQVLVVIGGDASTLVDITSGVSLATFEGDDLRLVETANSDLVILRDHTNDVLVGVDRATGTQLWSRPLGSAAVHTEQ